MYDPDPDRHIPDMHLQGMSDAQIIERGRRTGFYVVVKNGTGYELSAREVTPGMQRMLDSDPTVYTLLEPYSLTQP